MSVIQHRWYVWLLVALGSVTLLVAGLGARLADTPLSERGSIHQLLGLVLGIAMLLHFGIHARWLLKTARSFFSKATNLARLNFITSCLLAGTLVAVVASGVAAQSHSGYVDFWVTTHHLVAPLLLLLVGWHVVLHRRWLWARLRSVPAPEAAGRSG